jgi:hypothetical protein
MARRLHGKRRMPPQAPLRVVISSGRYGSLNQIIECARLLAPLERISIVVPPHDTANTRVEIAWYDGIELVVQVREQGTAVVRVPLAQAFAHDPLANIVFLPAEFSIVDPNYLAAVIREAAQCGETISVMGLPPFEWRSGKDYNPVIAVGSVMAFWDLLRAEHPRDAALLEHYIDALGTDDQGTALVAAYEQMQPLELTRDLLLKLRSVDLSTLSPMALGDRSRIVATFARTHRSSRSTGLYSPTAPHARVRNFRRGRERRGDRIGRQPAAAAAHGVRR